MGATCQAWPGSIGFACTGTGSSFRKLSSDVNEAQCTQSCISRMETTSLCCYVDPSGCWKKEGAQADTLDGGNGKAMMCTDKEANGPRCCQKWAWEHDGDCVEVAEDVAFCELTKSNCEGSCNGVWSDFRPQELASTTLTTTTSTTTLQAICADATGHYETLGDAAHCDRSTDIVVTQSGCIVTARSETAYWGPQVTVVVVGREVRFAGFTGILDGSVVRWSHGCVWKRITTTTTTVWV